MIKSINKLKFNDQVKLILTDVDETVADLYVPAERSMVNELINLLTENRVLFFITGQSISSVMWRITDRIPHYLRKNILIGHCNGAEVWGFDDQGGRLNKPFYSIYESTINKIQRKKWREIINQIITEFKLTVYPTMPVDKFIHKSNRNILSVMLEDRGPQITFEFVNSYDLNPQDLSQIQTEIPKTHGAYDLRIPIMERADFLLKKAHIPISPRLGGVFALDFAIEGVSKTTAVHHVLDDYEVLKWINLSKHELENPKYIEVWGDKFSTIRGGSDRHMSEAVSPEVRSIDFRTENPKEFPETYNIVL